jgi:hypothetical protein
MNEAEISTKINDTSIRKTVIDFLKFVRTRTMLFIKVIFEIEMFHNLFGHESNFAKMEKEVIGNRMFICFKILELVQVF